MPYANGMHQARTQGGVAAARPQDMFQHQTVLRPRSCSAARQVCTRFSLQLVCMFPCVSPTSCPCASCILSTAVEPCTVPRDQPLLARHHKGQAPCRCWVQLWCEPDTARGKLICIILRMIFLAMLSSRFIVSPFFVHHPRRLCMRRSGTRRKGGPPGVRRTTARGPRGRDRSSGRSKTQSYYRKF